MSSRLTEQRSIASQLVLLFAPAAALLLLCALGVLYLIVVRHTVEEDNAVLVDKLAAVGDDLRETGNPEALRDELQVTRRRGRAAYLVRVIAADGTTVAESPEMQHLLPPAIFAARASAKQPPRAVRADGKLFSIISADISASGNVYVVQVAQDRSDDDRFRDRFGLLTIVVLSCGVAASIALAVVATRRGLKPLTEMTGAVQRIRPAQMSERLVASRWPRELQPLSSAFDRMLDRLEHSFARLSQFSGDLAHELRTPIANILGEAQVALTRSRTADEYRAVIESSVVECERLSAIVDNLLFLARADAAEPQLHCEQFDARAAIEKITGYYRLAADDREITITCAGEGKFFADRLLFERAVTNLVDNALRHTPDGGEIALTIAEADHSAALVVSDNGSGIPPEHLPRVFDRFYRVDPSRSASGTGLGLALVKSIAELHGGAVTIENAPGGGTTARLSFPRPS